MDRKYAEVEGAGWSASARRTFHVNHHGKEQLTAECAMQERKAEIGP